MLQLEALPVLASRGVDTGQAMEPSPMTKNNLLIFPSGKFTIFYYYFQDCMVIFTSADLVANGNLFVEF